MKIKSMIGVLVVLAAIVLSQSLVIIDETEQVVITQFGEPVRQVKEAGLTYKLPFIQSVTRFDKRILEYDSRPTEVITKDKKNLVIDNYAKWRIEDPLKFLQSVRSENGAQSRLDDIIYSELRIELGKYDLIEIVSSGRDEIMNKVTERSDSKASEYGIEIVDVRIKRADLPQENEQAVFERMITERERQAKKYRSEGREQAAKIQAAADKEKEIILAEAYRQAEIIRGEGDAEALRIYAEAYNADPEFYNFIRALEAYEKSLDEDTTVILSESDFLKYLKQPGRSR